MDTAWMLRNDGKAIPVVQHIYANVDEPEETLAAAQWLYENTGHASTRQLILETIALWAQSLPGTADMMTRVFSEIALKPYRFLSAAFVNLIEPELRAVQPREPNLPLHYQSIAAELNQEFLRARYGGMYHTAATSKDMVFRISSTGFSWRSVIKRFLSDIRLPIATVTVVRDEESTGVPNAFYHLDGWPCDKMPLAHILQALQDTAPLPEGISASLHQRICDQLDYGAALRELEALPIPKEQLASTLEMMAACENGSPRLL